MRNTEAQRYARWSLAAAALLALLVAGVYLRNVYIARQAEKKEPPAVPPTVEQRSNEFSFSKVEGQRTIYTVRASRATEFKEGSRSLLEDVDISVYGRKGDRNDSLRTRACDFISTTGKISCAGEVQISLESAGKPRASANAIQVATSAVTFNRDSGEVRSDKLVTFRWPAGRGSAVGVSYDSNSGTLHLEHDVDLNLSNSSPSPAEKTDPAVETTLHLTGDSMQFQRDARRVQMGGDVRAQQSTRELSAGNLLLELDGEFHARRLVASENPQLRDAGVLGTLALSAVEIASNMRPDGSVDSLKPGVSKSIWRRAKMCRSFLLRAMESHLSPRARNQSAEPGVWKPTDSKSTSRTIPIPATSRWRGSTPWPQRVSNGKALRP